MQRRNFLKSSVAMLSAAIVAPAMFADQARADAMADAMAIVEKYAQKVTAWDGPTSGPGAQEGKTIVVLAGDLKNGGILGVTTGVWHAGPTIGPDDKIGLFANVSTDAMQVSAAAANWAYADAKGKPGVVIFTDSTYAIAIAKADRMKEEIEKLGGTVLEYVDTPIAETSQRMPQLTTSLLQKYGDSWTHSLAINDLYFDFMGPSLAAAGKTGTDAPINVAAGDGSESAYQRIRAGQFQKVTVAEPLNLQGWQLVDELNRAIAGVKWSGYLSPLHVVTADNVEFDGGPKNSFDPDNGYRDEYKKMWGKM
ncbi:substrate-binding domain-containing protein [Mesorhizobium sp.]|uniref:substrate-binding domain-containing protein n=1 Tax=Mesorhizobium sp. TaxID=1871066 RepID=UPI000FE5ABBA|nr:substrate-binding domain-containing protein [Mesorhizobium sp.]RWO50495.1 MAG: sugar ABC transporter substrate-binding protein [Mesorhizobium sp.]TIN25058.1 MAG: sugar ABC transporter substrate-binding protein [Mesorhizobium sp.]TJU83352.1 MAG: sugar ABC transporter substrate-binding protein [Mesorhizobium sp.]